MGLISCPTTTSVYNTDFIYIIQPGHPQVDATGLEVLQKKVLWPTLIDRISEDLIPIYQGLNTYLTTISEMSPVNNDFMQFKSGAWAHRTIAQVKVDLAIDNVSNTAPADMPISTATQTALNGKQPLHARLTEISGLTFAADDMIQFKAGALVNRTIAQLKTDFGLTDENIQDMISMFLYQGNNISMVYDDAGNKFTIHVVPAGIDTNVQFNNAGVLGTSNNFRYVYSTNTLYVAGTDAGLVLTGVTNYPTNALTNEVRVFNSKKASKPRLSWIGDTDIMANAQPLISERRIGCMSPQSGTAYSTWGVTLTPQGQITTPVLTSTDFKSQSLRTAFETNNPAGSVAGIYTPNAEIWRGNAAGLGGFEVTIAFGIEVMGVANRLFAGLSTFSGASVNLDPTTDTTQSRVGVGINSNTGNFKIVHGAGGVAPTIIDLGSNFPVNSSYLYSLTLYSPPNGSYIGYRVRNRSTGVDVSGQLTTNIPNNTTFLTVRAWITNNATAGRLMMSIARLYIETNT